MSSSKQKQNRKIQEKKEFNWNNNTSSIYFQPKNLKINIPSIVVAQTKTKIINEEKTLSLN